MKTMDIGIIDLGISDNNLIYICRKVSVLNLNLSKTRQYKHYNMIQFQKDLKEGIHYRTTTSDPNNT